MEHGMKKPDPPTVCWNCQDRSEHCAIGCERRAREREKMQEEYKRRILVRDVSDAVRDMTYHRVNTRRKKKQ